MNGDAISARLQRTREVIRSTQTIVATGRVTGFVGTVIRARVPGVCIGERCRIFRASLAGETPPLAAEVVGFDEASGTLLMPLGHAESIALDDIVEPEGVAARVPCGDAMLGRVIDAQGNPIDGGPTLTNVQYTRLISAPPHALRRKRISEPISTGVRVIDTLLTVGRGQRVCIIAPAGGGKSTLLAALARNVDADAIVLALIGERRREVAPFIEDNLGEAGLARSTIVVSTSDEPALPRLMAAHTASAIAEAHRAAGRRVVLLMDSVTRFARALREVGLAAGELPARRGFPPSVFAALPRLFERAGNDANGSVTAFYTVLQEGEIADDPIAEETKSLLDGHFVLSEELAMRQHYPAIDPKTSKSRCMDDIVSSEHRRAASAAKEIWSRYERERDKITLGLYEEGSNAVLDDTIRRHALLEGLFRQQMGEAERAESAIARLCECVHGAL